MTLKNILGGGPYLCLIQNLIMDAVGAFLIALGVLHAI
jgi:hypothetical protein